jgi:hypothetical protein
MSQEAMMKELTSANETCHAFTFLSQTQRNFRANLFHDTSKVISDNNSRAGTVLDMLPW